jgi:tetratricopeptide (TPR) repeat protein
MSRLQAPSRKKPLLSAAIIVRDDALGLAETLKSISGVADEVVVLDTGSRDGTPEVARRLGARLVERPWDDDFSAARNACFAHATGDWMLWLDSGERLLRESIAPLRTIVERPEPATSAYRVIVRIPPPSPDAQAEEIAPVRLVPRIESLRFVGRVRESLAASLAESGLSVEPSAIVVERGAREHDAARKTDKARRDLRLAQRDLAERGQIAEALLAKGEASCTLSRHAEAIDLLRLAIASSERGSAAQLAAYGALLATLDTVGPAAGDTLRVRIAVGLEALDVFPLDAQLLLAIGGYLQAQGQIELAARSFRMAWEHGTVSPDVWHVADPRSLAASWLSIALQLLGREGEAAVVLETALGTTRDETRLRRRLLEVHVRNGQRDAALAQADRLASTTEKARLRSAVRGACLGAKGNWASALAHLDTAYRQGCRDAVCLRAYCQALLATGQRQAAEGVIDEWLSAAPGHAEALEWRAMARGDAASSSSTRSPARGSLPSTGDALPESSRKPRLRVDSSAAESRSIVPEPLSPLAPTAMPRPESAR